MTRHLASEMAREQLQLVDGRPYTEHVPDVKALIRARSYDEAAGLLLRLIDAIEREASIPLAGHTRLPPWYYRQLASVYRKLGRSDLSEGVERRFTTKGAEVERMGLEAKQRMLEALLPPSRPAVRLGALAGKLLGRILRTLFGRR